MGSWSIILHLGILLVGMSGSLSIAADPLTELVGSGEAETCRGDAVSREGEGGDCGCSKLSRGNAKKDGVIEETAAAINTAGRRGA